MTYVPADDRYDLMPYRRCGRSGLKLPAIALWLFPDASAIWVAVPAVPVALNVAEERSPVMLAVTAQSSR